MSGAAGTEVGARSRVIRVFLVQGIAGLALLVAMTVLRVDETAAVIASLGTHTYLLVLVFVMFVGALGLLRFELTNLIFASLMITADMAMFPLLGMVISAWIAVIVAGLMRLMGLLQIGPVKIPMEDPTVEYVKTFGLFGTYGIPVVVATLVFEGMGGTIPVLHASADIAAKLTIANIAMIITNNLVMARVMRTYGYPLRKMLVLSGVDISIYLLTLPFAIMLTFSYGTMGLAAVVSLAFTGVLANYVARSLAITRSRSQQLIQRLMSLSNIGKTISLRISTADLMMSIYLECSKIVDASLFTIALVDEMSNELVFELDIRDGVVLPRERMPLGEGLNSWVVMHHQALLIGSVDEERRLGLSAIQDSKPTESWIGVPMIARDRVIGVISVESYRQFVFTKDDILLLTAIANQAAVALENAQLYKDLEGLTLALEHRVLERTNELREANLRLMAADRSKNQFLANMSHELRTPLNSIIGFSSVLLENTREMIPPRLYKFLENIRTAGHHLLELINDILDLSKIEAGKMELRPDWFDIRDTVSAVDRVMRGFASEANVTILTSVDSEVPRVRLDEGRLKQILFNLLSNAVKFSPDGGPVRIAISALSRETSPLEIDSIRIEVADKGIGMESAELNKIFEEFYQTEKGKRSARGGTGLGLSLTRNFVELHHGTIDVRSAPLQGSTFVMHLPVDYQEATADYPRLRATMGAGAWL